MPQIRLLDSGFAHFTGNLGGHDFEDGVSVDSIGHREVMRIAGITQVETIDGKDPSETSHYNAIKSGEIVAEKEEGIVLEGAGEKLQATQYEFTRESLESLADAKGISGLRELAKPYGIKGQSISALIESLMALKEGQA